jgi:ABC-type protease/lipase transport system fused ATPase/permease subunit
MARLCPFASKMSILEGLWRRKLHDMDWNEAFRLYLIIMFSFLGFLALIAIVSVCLMGYFYDQQVAEFVKFEEEEARRFEIEQEEEAQRENERAQDRAYASTGAHVIAIKLIR